MAFCPHCGKEVSPDAFACPACGHPLKQFQPAVRPSEPVSGLWWLLPLFLAWIGGLIAYFVLKDSEGQLPAVLFRVRTVPLTVQRGREVFDMEIRSADRVPRLRKQRLN